MDTPDLDPPAALSDPLSARVDRYAAVIAGATGVAAVPHRDLPLWQRYRKATADAIRAVRQPSDAVIYPGWERRARRIAEAHDAEECCL